MSEGFDRKACGCGKQYLFGGAYRESVCPGCLPAREGYARTPEQAGRLHAAWRACFGPKLQEQEATAA